MNIGSQKHCKRRISIITNKKEFPHILKRVYELQYEIKELIKLMLKLDIKDIEIEGIKNYYNISEYNFYVLKIKGELKDKTKLEFYIKLIKNGQIKENIFCFSYILYNGVYHNENEYKIKIQEKESSIWKNKIILYLEENKIELNKKLEINLFNLNKITEKVIMNKINNMKDIIEKEDVLLVGVKIIN